MANTLIALSEDVIKMFPAPVSAARGSACPGWRPEGVRMEVFGSLPTLHHDEGERMFPQTLDTIGHAMIILQTQACGYPINQISLIIKL